MNVQTIYEDTRANGGSSTDLLGKSPTTGYMVSIYPGRELSLYEEDFTPYAIANYIANHVEVLAREDHYLGTWNTNGLIYLDIALNVPKLEEALSLGLRHRQLAVFSVEENASIGVV